MKKRGACINLGPQSRIHDARTQSYCAPSSRATPPRGRQLQRCHAPWQTRRGEGPGRSSRSLACHRAAGQQPTEKWQASSKRYNFHLWSSSMLKGDSNMQVAASSFCTAVEILRSCTSRAPSTKRGPGPARRHARTLVQCARLPCHPSSDGGHPAEALPHGATWETDWDAGRIPCLPDAQGGPCRIAGVRGWGGVANAWFDIEAKQNSGPMEHIPSTCDGAL